MRNPFSFFKKEKESDTSDFKIPEMNHLHDDKSAVPQDNLGMQQTNTGMPNPDDIDPMLQHQQDSHFDTDIGSSFSQMQQSFDQPQSAQMPMYQSQQVPSQNQDQEKATNAVIVAKLDAVLAKLDSLEYRLASVERDVKDAQQNPFFTKTK